LSYDGRPARNKHPATDNPKNAADQYDNAAKHHREAAKDFEEGKHETAAHHAHTAHRLASNARNQATKASRKHAHEHGGGQQGSGGTSNKRWSEWPARRHIPAGRAASWTCAKSVTV
jgi:hypothetical protein